MKAGLWQLPILLSTLMLLLLKYLEKQKQKMYLWMQLPAGHCEGCGLCPQWQKITWLE